MPRTYNYDTHKRCNSIIKDTNGCTYSTISVPSAGNTADTRFFGKAKEKIFVVKRPKYYGKHGSFAEETIKKIDLAFEDEYRHEQNVWNQIYPHNKAELFTGGGLRLVLPCLSGVTLQESLSEDPYKIDPLRLCQKLLAVAYAVQNFYKSGFKYSDFNLDNVLIEEKSNGIFHACLIDFNCVRAFDEHGGYQELNFLNILVPGAQWDLHYNSIDTLINALGVKIDGLKNKRTQERKISRMFDFLPKTIRNDLIKQFVEFLDPNKSVWPSECEKLAIYKKLYEQEGLEHFLIWEQLSLFLRSRTPSIHDQLSQNVSEDEVIPICRLA